MGVRPEIVEVHIGELSVEEPASIDSWVFRNALQRELTRLLGTVMHSDNEGNHIVNNRTTDSIEVDSHDSGAALGAEVARVVYQELQK